jgi:hypothetical protein
MSKIRPIQLRIPRKGVKNPTKWREKAESPAGSDAQQVVTGEFGLVGDEGEPRFGLGAHQPFDRIGGAFAVVGRKKYAPSDIDAIA